MLKYVADITNTSIMPTTFVEAFAWHIAGPLAMALRGDEKKAEACVRMAERKIAEAFIITERDQQGDPEPISEFEAARET